jgi:hypothetical protein
MPIRLAPVIQTEFGPIRSSGKFSGNGRCVWRRQFVAAKTRQAFTRVRETFCKSGGQEASNTCADLTKILDQTFSGPNRSFRRCLGGLFPADCVV